MQWNVAIDSNVVLLFLTVQLHLFNITVQLIETGGGYWYGNVSSLFHQKRTRLDLINIRGMRSYFCFIRVFQFALALGYGLNIVAIFHGWKCSVCQNIPATCSTTNCCNYSQTMHKVYSDIMQYKRTYTQIRLCIRQTVSEELHHVFSFQIK